MKEYTFIIVPDPLTKIVTRELINQSRTRHRASIHRPNDLQPNPLPLSSGEESVALLNCVSASMNNY